MHALMRTVVLALLVSSPLLLPGVAAAAERRPNVLFLFTDDQRADTIGALGNPAIKTPNLDKLARRGFAFDNAYCMGGNVGAVCLPSRNMLLSGRAYFRWQDQGTRGMALPDRPNFPDAMKAAGYETFHEGKRGNTALKIQERFDHNRYLQDEKARTSGEHGKQECDDAIAFLKGRKADKPFFMYLAFAGPHDPRVAAGHYLSQYDRSKIPLPRNYRPVHPFDNGWMDGRDEQLEAWPRTEEAVRRHLHEYYACITSIDGHVGRLMAALDELKLADDTIVVFSADNGLAIGSHGLFGKQNVYEVGMKVPLVVAGPGVPHGRSDALVYLYDIFPSVCEMIGSAVPQGLDGVSFAPVVRGQKPRTRDSLFLAYETYQRAVRDERWKLIRYPQVDKTQLFDLKADPDEVNDLSADPAHRGQIDRLLAVMADWQKQLGDTQPLTVANPKNPAWVPPVGGPPAKPRAKGAGK